MDPDARMALRVGDREREETAEGLREHAAAGAEGGWDEFWPKWVFIVTTVILVRRLLRLRRDDGYRNSDST